MSFFVRFSVSSCACCRSPGLVRCGTARRGRGGQQPADAHAFAVRAQRPAALWHRPGAHGVQHSDHSVKSWDCAHDFSIQHPNNAVDNAVMFAAARRMRVLHGWTQEDDLTGGSETAEAAAAGDLHGELPAIVIGKSGAPPLLRRHPPETRVPWVWRHVLRVGGGVSLRTGTGSGGAEGSSGGWGAVAALVLDPDDIYKAAMQEDAEAPAAMAAAAPCALPRFSLLQ